MNKWSLINADSGEKTWLTPRNIIVSLGHFDTDPCCPPNMPWKTADVMLTKHEDGTLAPWHGRVWLNPPYGRESYPFLERMSKHDGGGYRPVVCKDRYGDLAVARISVCFWNTVHSWTSALSSPRRDRCGFVYCTICACRVFRGRHRRPCE